LCWSKNDLEESYDIEGVTSESKIAVPASIKGVILSILLRRNTDACMLWVQE
jgi:hypothetical protein